MQAATQAAQSARNAPLRARAKSVPADLVTDADARAEHAAAEIIRAARPDDAIVGEEGTSDAGTTGRRWYLDGIDGTVAFANRFPGGWCSAVALVDDDGPLVSAVHDPLGELYAAARGEGATCNGEPLAIRTGRTLEQAHVALFLRQDRLVQPGVRANGHAIMDRAGLFRHAGPGTLELAWIAAGRLDAWIQPSTDPWDWHPGALLVTEAGGATRVVQRETRWHVAGPSSLVDALVALLT
ncbi:fructose-1,6-bisphosphatase/inositol monophosphatase family enzyme [Solirubrobacter pauli]|uniref:Fructose-1,6-bisphosphatase/inositol monophosphatase family enzyme n=1 Tax=Solirubrobacter pauli TaxID=166793 RepID=A0A660LFI3_9ACTN|nr:fructose-1,6-bisphosphatase/inositol monophosphatase family enzyme [Solirubrobacter pauli]